MTSSDETRNELSRRELIRAALCAGLSIVGVAGCGGETAQTAQTGVESAPLEPVAALANANGTATVAGGGKLKAGTAMPITLPNGGQPAMLVKTKSGQLLAMSALCTHAGCRVTWMQEDARLRCPCHGSLFDETGRVLTGPATVALPKIAVSAKGDDAILNLKS